MKFSVVAVAVLVAAGIGAYWWNKNHPSTALSPQNQDTTPQKTGSAHTTDPLVSADDVFGPLATPTNEVITEAAYHQQPIAMTSAFGSDENIGGNEELSFL